MRRAGSPATQAESYLTFQIGDTHYAVRRNTVQEVLPLAAASHPASIALGNVHYPVVDPRHLFGLPPWSQGERQMILQGSEDRLSALVVDRIEGQISIDARRFQAVPWHFGGREQLWFEGVAALDARRALVLLHTQGLLASLGSPTTESERERRS